MRAVTLNPDYYLRLSLLLTALAALSLAYIAEVFSFPIQLYILVMLPLVFSPNRTPYQEIKSAINVGGWFAMAWSLFQVISTSDVIYLGDSLAIIMMMNLISLKSRVRCWFVLISSLLLCFSGLVLEPGVIAYLFFISYLLAASAALNGIFIYFLSEAQLERRTPLGSAYFLPILKTVPFGIFVAVCVFILFPRMNRLSLELPFEVKQRYKTGYSGEVDLSGRGALGEDETVVLQVSSRNTDWLRERGNSIYFRGTALEGYRKGRWRQVGSSMRSYTPYQPISLRRAISRQRPLELSIIAEAMREQTVFLPQDTLMLRGMSDSIEPLSYDTSDGTLLRGSDNPERYRYDIQLFAQERPAVGSVETYLRSLDQIPVETEDRASLISSKRLGTLRQLPPDIRRAAYFNNWKKPLLARPEEAFGAYLQRINAYFQQNYTATLLNDIVGSDSLAEFLGRQKRGHCEYFATATALLLRSQGFPTRIVTGYRGGDFNSYAGALIVRQSHAHAWLEVYLPAHGWLTVDPTPTVAASAENQLVNLFREYSGAANFFLSRYLVDYSLSTQRDLISQVRTNLSKPKLPPLKFLAYFIITAGFVLLSLYLLKTRQRRPRKTKKDLPAFYIDYLQRQQFAKEGLTRRAGESYRVFHQRLAADSKDVDHAELAEIDRKLHHYLYSEEMSRDG